MKIAAIQHDIIWSDREANFARISPMITEAAGGGARLVVLTEMFSTGFVVDNPDIAEELGGPSSRFLAEQAQQHRVWIAGTCPEKHPDDPRPYNTLVVAGPSGEMHRYSKIHPFTYGGEDKHYRPGDSFVTVTIDGIRTSLFVCYDLRFADEFWTLAPDTDMYIVPANWPESRREHWMALLRARAIENQAYVVGVNRVGDGGGLHYSGDSMIIDPMGEAVQSPKDEESITYADISLERTKEVRTRFPFLRDRR